LSWNLVFCYLGYYIGSRFKIVEIKENESTKIINNKPTEESQMKKLLKKEEQFRIEYENAAKKYFLEEDEDATVPGDEDAK
jgi:hypothetical protein